MVGNGGSAVSFFVLLLMVDAIARSTLRKLTLLSSTHAPSGFRLTFWRFQPPSPLQYILGFVYKDY
ncbi:MAG: hypothetical protein JGK26_22560 [Microcoleus sp. PH2017_27_LUM_O_A]|uniref:hypothetical protein n=1 Tax=unclassified Microcoleus TaxID=2642155 RepID=UPI001D23C815|nr:MULTISPECIES: hypothetical protein [unclassified Microcoleus]MCC3462507.1 hypothetical protein [Microcoleus sp. PH2017_11_PCY_U_A]MCC3561862.1 hypothetical protein [Microcoleus sp. PH2017_27_LUM_O_A]